MDMIFENYERFVTDNKSSFSSGRDVIGMYNDKVMFADFCEHLTEGYEPVIKNKLISVLNRQKFDILTEMSNPNIAASNYPIAWTVQTFPMIVDIYAEPIIAELMNVWPTDVPVATIPRVRVKARVPSYDGTTYEEVYIPNATKLIKPGNITVNVAPGQQTNLFKGSVGAIDQKVMKINPRFTSIVSLHITESGGAEYNVNVRIRADNRNQFRSKEVFTDSIGSTCTMEIQGNINYQEGTVLIHATPIKGTPGITYTCSYATFSVRFMPGTSMNGVTQLEIETQGMDITIPQNENFLIKLAEEDVQDFTSIFNIDLLRTYSDAIKRQILLNKDMELAHFLSMATVDMDKMGTGMKCDLDKYRDQGGVLSPNSVTDVFRGIVPQIGTLINLIRRNINIYPSYLVCGLKVASALRSLQTGGSNIPDMRGEIGFHAGQVDFMKLKVLEATSIPENMMYVSTKAPANSLEKSTIVDFVHKPLYTIKEINKTVSH